MFIEIQLVTVEAAEEMPLSTQQQIFNGWQEKVNNCLNWDMLVMSDIHQIIADRTNITSDKSNKVILHDINYSFGIDVALSPHLLPKNMDQLSEKDLALFQDTQNKLIAVNRNIIRMAIAMQSVTQGIDSLDNVFPELENSNKCVKKYVQDYQNDKKQLMQDSQIQ